MIGACAEELKRFTSDLDCEFAEKVQNGPPPGNLVKTRNQICYGVLCAGYP